MTTRKQILPIIVAMALTLPLIGSNVVRGLDGQQHRLSVAGDHLSCSVEVPTGWRPHKSATGLQYLIPAAQKDEHGTSIYVWDTPREGKKATKLFDTDEYLTTSDGKMALIRYGRGGAIQSVIRPSDFTNPYACAYIEEGDFFVLFVLSTTDEKFVDAKQAFKTVVESYRATPPNKSLD